MASTDFARSGFAYSARVLRVPKPLFNELISHLAEARDAAGGPPNAVALCDRVAASPDMLAGAGRSHASCWVPLPLLGALATLIQHWGAELFQMKKAKSALAVKVDDTKIV